jgi:Fe-S-cluster containining protein
MSNCVTNGCNGSCCAKFTLPFTIKELQDSLAAQQQGKSHFTNRHGVELATLHPASELPFIIDMLIYLGTDPIDPQTKRSINSVLNEHINKFKDYIDLRGKPAPEQYAGINWLSRHDLEGDNIVVQTYTCRHFDTVNRICTVYDQRPMLCRTFGIQNECSYTGCNINKNTQTNEQTQQQIHQAK